MNDSWERWTPFQSLANLLLSPTAWHVHMRLYLSGRVDKMSMLEKIAWEGEFIFKGAIRDGGAKLSWTSLFFFLFLVHERETEERLGRVSCVG